MGKDYYKVLGVNKNSSQDEIKKAFRKKAHEFHPDKAGGDEAKFKEVNEAYQVLGDDKKRSQYDQFGSAFEGAQSHGGFHGFDGFRDFSGAANGMNFDMDDLGDLFGGIGDMFGFGGRGGAKQARARRGNDIETVLTIDFNEAVFGTEKEVGLRKLVKCDRCAGNGAEPGAKIETCATCKGSGRITRAQRTILGTIQTQTVCPDCSGEGKTYTQKCSKCHGAGVTEDTVELKVKIPAGIDDGEAIRISGHGGAGMHGGPSGDLYIRVKVKSDKRFVRDRYDIKSEASIGFTQAALGDKIDIETIDGPLSLKIPAGTQSGTNFRLKGLGVYKLHNKGRGDHYVNVKIKTPTSLSRKQKQLLKDLDL